MDKMERDSSVSEAQYSAEAVWDRFLNLLQRLDDHFDILYKLSIVKQWALAHPLFSLFVAIMVVFCSVPVMVFVGFVVGSLVFTVIGILMLEGTFLTVAVLIFCGVVCLACLAALGVTAFLVSAWFLINVAMDFIYSAKIHAQDYVPFPCFQKSALPVETWPARQDKCQGSNPSAKEE